MGGPKNYPFFSFFFHFTLLILHVADANQHYRRHRRSWGRNKFRKAEYLNKSRNLCIKKMYPFPRASKYLNLAQHVEKIRKILVLLIRSILPQALISI
jgi:hypothetical protein